MKRVAALLGPGLLLLPLALAAPGCDSKPVAAGIANPDPNLCLVSGEKLPSRPEIVEVGGKKYALCCLDCEPALRKDPERFLKNPGSGSMPGDSMPKK